MYVKYIIMNYINSTMFLNVKILNKIDGLDNPSSENLCKWIWAELIPSLPGLSQIEIKETDSTGCIYKGE